MKFFEKDKKNFVSLIEKSTREETTLLTFEGQNIYKNYVRKLAQEGKTQIDISGIYKTRNEFLLSGERNAWIDNLKWRVQKKLSIGAGGGVEDVRSVSNFSRKNVFAKSVLSLSKERAV